MNPVNDEPTWTPVESETGTYYTRQLLGSELWADEFDVSGDGTGNCCMGFDFTSTLPFEVLYERACGAVSRLRFSCPIIASYLTYASGQRCWYYTPVSDVSDVRRWAQETIVARAEPISGENFTQAMGHARLPHVLPSGHRQVMRCYLIKTPDKEARFSLFWHGTHAIMDARPTISAFSLMFEWMSMSKSEPLEILPWGTEWRNLPPGPVTCTGGPRPKWDSYGKNLLDKVGGLIAGFATTRSLRPQFKDADAESPEKTIRLHVELDQDLSSRLFEECKRAGHTITHLFEAAVVLALFSYDLLPDDSDAQVTLPNLISLKKYQIPPYNSKTHFISSMVMAPMQIRYKDIVAIHSTNDKARLVAVMQAFKAQYTEYSSNPHLPHLLAALTAFKTSTGPPLPNSVEPNPQMITLTNLGRVDPEFATVYHPDGDRGQPPVFDIVKLVFGHRLKKPSPLVHIWSMHARINIQVQASEVWDEGCVQSFLDKCLSEAMVLLTCTMSAAQRCS